MKSMVYTVNTTSQLMSLGSTIPLGSTIRRIGCSTFQEGNAITVNSRGYYQVTANIAGSATADGIISVTAYNGTEPIPGTTSQAEVLAGDVITLPVMGVFRNRCCPCESPASISFVWTGAAGTLTSITAKVESI